MNNEAGVGCLGYQNIEIQETPFYNNFSIRCWRHYQNLLDTTPIGKKISEFVNSDARCTSLEGRLLSSGSGGQIYHANNLSMWFLRRANKVGENQAWNELENYLNNDSVQVVCTLWVLGLSAAERVEIANGVNLLSAREMPDSADKEKFLQAEHSSSSMHGQRFYALTKVCTVKKIISADPNALCDFGNEDLQRASIQLQQLAILINSLPQLCCVPYLSTSYTMDHAPLGPFGGSGGGMPIFDVGTFGATFFRNEYIPELQELLTAFSRCHQDEQNRIERILMRISQAKRRLQSEDKILDFGIAMEMLLLDDNEKDQLSLSFRLRGSWLLARSEEDRKDKYELLKKMYNLRSSVAHTGTIYGNVPKKVQSAISLIPDFQKFAENLARKIIKDGSPNWDAVVLNLSGKGI